MIAVRMQSLGTSGTEPAAVSPFHALMASRLEREGVLRRPSSGGFLVAVSDGDLATVEALRSGAEGTVRVRGWDGINLVHLTAFGDVLSAEMRCSLLTFPGDFLPDAAAPAAPAPVLVDGPLMDSLAEAIQAGLSDILASSGPARSGGPLGEQFARDLPQIERIMREAGLRT